MFPRSSLKTCLICYTWIFKPVLTYICGFDPQTHVHRDVCKRPNIFVVFLDVDSSHYLLDFHIPWDCSDLTFHYPSEALYKKPFGYIEGGELKSKKTIVHCCHSLIILESASIYPLEHFVFFPSFPLLVSLLSRDGGLNLWFPKL